MNRLHKFIPIVGWISAYNKENLGGDVSAGLTVGIMLVPQGMAYAMIAGLPPVYGLYAAIFPQVIYAIFGSSRQLSVGPSAMDSLLIAAGISLIAVEGTEAYLQMAILLAFLVGLFQLLTGLLKMGFLANLLSKPVISGFTSAAAVIIALNQIRYLLGIPIISSNHIVQLIKDLSGQLHRFHWITGGIGIAAIVLIIISGKLNKKIPGSLVAVVLAISITWFFELDQQGVEIIKTIPKGLPDFIFPDFSLTQFKEILPLAVTIAIVAFMESVSIGKAIESLEKDHRVRPNQELVALGMSNLVGSIFQAFPVAGGFARSAVNHRSGAKTQLSAFVAAGLVAMTLLFLTPLFYYLPKAVLAAVIVVGVAGLIDFRYARYLIKVSRSEFALLIATFLVTIILGMVQGIVTGIIISVLILLFRIAYPHIAVLGRLKGHYEFRNVKRFNDLEQWEHLLVVRIDAPILFVNILYLRDFIEQEVIKNKKVETIILDAGAVNHIDATAVQGLWELLNSLQKQNIRLLFAELVGPVRDSLYRSGLINDIKSNVFMDVNEAVNYVVENKEPLFKSEAMQSDRPVFRDRRT